MHYAVSFRSLATMCLLWLMGAAFCGCSSPPEQASERDSFESLLGDLDTSEAFFSLSFDAPPPDGTFFIGVASARADFCSLVEGGFKTNVAGQESSFWFLTINLADLSHSQYTIVAPPAEDDDSSLDSEQASLMVTRIENGEKKTRFFATGGTITVEDAPETISQWQDGGDASLAVDAEFLPDPVREVRCDGAVRVERDDAGHAEPSEDDWEKTCECESFSGDSFTCESSSLAEGCCQPRTDERIHFRTTLRMRQCANMCIVSSLPLLRYCSELE